MTGTSANRRVRAALAVIVVVAFAAMVGFTRVTPAVASVSSITPSSANLGAGEQVSATVAVESTKCIEVSKPHPTITASVEAECGGGSWSTVLRVSTSSTTPPGTYDVVVSDADSARSFQLTVRAAATTTTSQTTTTLHATTTTTTPPASTTTTAAPPPTTTTTPAPPTTLAPGTEPFASIASLVSRGVATDGMFLPLLSDRFSSCLPLIRACADRESGLMLLPARLHDVAWVPVAGGTAVPPSVALADVPPLQAIGVEPAAADASAFTLHVLDLASDGEPRSLARTLDASRNLTAPPSDSTSPAPETVVASLSKAAELPTTSVDMTGQPFGRPYRMTSTSLTEASPVLVAIASSPPTLLYGMRANPEWRLGTVFVPLLGTGAVPYLVRGSSGPAGLFLPIPKDAVLPASRALATGADDGSAAGPGDSRRVSWGVFAVAGGVVLGAGAGVALVVARRRRGPRFGR